MNTEYETDTYQTECVHCEREANWSEIDPNTDYPFGFIEDKWENLWCEECYNEDKKQQRRSRNERHSSISDYSHWNEEASIVKAQEDRYTEYYYEREYSDDY
jgi:hypothetical protein